MTAISPAAVRRHLDALGAQGRVEERRGGGMAYRGRGRPARHFRLTDAGRATFPHAYDNLALTALRHVARPAARTPSGRSPSSSWPAWRSALPPR